MKSVVPDVQLLAAYIDNYKGAGSPETAQRAAETLLVVAAQYRVTMNMEASAASAFEFRGIEFGIAHGGGLYATVSNKTRLKLAHAATNIGRITEWSMNELEQTFGLLAYVSYAMQLPLHEYYTVFKFIRRALVQRRALRQRRARQGTWCCRKNAHSVGIEPTTTRLRAVRSTV